MRNPSLGQRAAMGAAELDQNSTQPDAGPAWRQRPLQVASSKKLDAGKGETGGLRQSYWSPARKSEACSHW